jgi:hypothetical protein
MTTETKQLTAQDLALYLGQEFIYNGPSGHYVDKLNGFHLMTLEDRPGAMLLLRPLSDLTEEEAREIGRIGDWQFPFDLHDLTVSLMDIVQEYSAVWRYLLSIGIDLFDWIPAGLAIDKTKIPAEGC